MRQLSGDGGPAIEGGSEGTPSPETLESGRVVGLVVGHRHHELRNTRGEALRERTDAAVMHQRGATREKLTERYVVEVPHLLGERRRELIRIPGEEQPSPA